MWHVGFLNLKGNITWCTLNEISGLMKTLILSMCGRFGIKEWEGQRCTWVLSTACGRWWFTPPFHPPSLPLFLPQWQFADIWSASIVHGQHMWAFGSGRSRTVCPFGTLVTWTTSFPFFRCNLIWPWSPQESPSSSSTSTTPWNPMMVTRGPFRPHAARTWRRSWKVAVSYSMLWKHSLFEQCLQNVADHQQFTVPFRTTLVARTEGRHTFTYRYSTSGSEVIGVVTPRMAWAGQTSPIGNGLPCYS